MRADIPGEEREGEGRGWPAPRHTHPPWRGSGCRPPRNPCAAAAATDTQAAVWWTAAAAPRSSGVSAKGNATAAARPTFHPGRPQAGDQSLLSLGVGGGIRPPIATTGFCASWKKAPPFLSAVHNLRNYTWQPCENSPRSRPGAYNPIADPLLPLKKFQIN